MCQAAYFCLQSIQLYVHILAVKMIRAIGTASKKAYNTSYHFDTIYCCYKQIEQCSKLHHHSELCQLTVAACVVMPSSTPSLSSVGVAGEGLQLVE